MRKWQRDRNRRRKKPDQSGSEGQPRQEPLQPIYPDMQPDTSVAERMSAEEPQDDNFGNRVEPFEPAGESAATPGQTASPQRKRRRRGRGGRGRTGQQQGPQQSPPMSEVAPELPSAMTPPVPSSPAQQRSETQPPRPSRGVVVLAIGLPGSGKSSWFKRRGVTPLSSDLLRTLLFDNITEQKYQDLVFGTLRSLLRARLIARMPWNYVDATNLSPKERTGWIKMSKEYGYDVHAVFFDVPLEVCKARNLQRARMVPDEVMERFAEKLRPPTFDEGFSKIIVVRVKKRDDEPTSEVI
jgi:predicted kinase